MTKLVIEKGVAIPPRSSGSVKNKEERETFLSMVTGDSVLFSFRDRADYSRIQSKAAVLLGTGNYTVRMVSGVLAGPGEMRIWKIKDRA